MANQSPDRRRILELIGVAVTASQFGGFSRWACAQELLAQHSGHSEMPVSEPSAHFVPQFFNAQEYALLDHLCELIIPAGDSPGAHAAGVSEFIDRMAAHDQTIQQPFRNGLAWFDKYASQQHGSAGFSGLSTDQQQQVLRALAYRDHHVAGQESQQAFFRLLRRYTVMGYYTSKIGLQELDYPGLKLYAQSPACPHVNDREHKHLPPPQVKS
jgi:gluconate 2-dehydrogenase gamma chain